MKELYISPELKVTCFAPVERLANDDGIKFDDLLDAADKVFPEVDPSDGDFGIIV